MEDSILTSRRLSPLTTATGLLSFAVIGASQAMYGPALPHFTERFALQPGAAGLIVSAHSAGAIIGILSGVPLARLPLARWRVGISLALMLAGALCIGAEMSWALALVGGLVIGIGFGGLALGINSLYAVGFGHRSPAMVNLLNAVFGIGAMLSPLLFLVDFARGGMPFFVLAGVITVLLPLGFMMDDRLPKADPNAPRPGNRRAAFLAFIVLLALGVGVEATTVGYAATYLVAIGVSLEGATTATSLFFLLFMLGRLSIVPISLRVKSSHIVMGSLLLTTLLLLAANVVLIAPVMIVLLGAAIGIYFPNCFNWFNKVFASSSSGTAYIMASGLTGGTLIPAMVAQLVPLVGERAIMGLVASFSFVALIIGLFVKARLAASEAAQ
ncbi:MAG: MFS transporter [Ardenticatenaceae bacterium]|nr:MFS transporter [Ardenticatenaceae bacterium]